MNKEEQEIIESTKEFAKAHNIHYDQMTENMILNAMREQLLLHDVSVPKGTLLFHLKALTKQIEDIHCYGFDDVLEDYIKSNAL